MHLDEMLAADLGVLWVVGANPLKGGRRRARPDSWWSRTCSSPRPPQQADVVLPAACAYEKNGTVTNVTGEVQRLKRAINTMGAKPDLEIMGFIAREMGVAAALGPWVPDVVFEEIRKTVRGYEVPTPVIATGGAAQTMPVNGRIPVEIRPDLVHSDHNGLFASGTLGRYSKVLQFRCGKPLEPLMMDSFIVISLIKVLVVFAVLMTTLAYLQWVERKVIAHIQVRPGPYRVGPHGLLQPLADVIKLITKEDLVPPYVNKPLYLLAPFLAITMALLSISVIPFGPEITVAGLPDADAAHRPEHRSAVRAGGLVHGRVRHRAGRLVVEQQVRAAGRPAQLGADDQLRTAAVAGHRRAAADLEHLEPARAGGEADPAAFWHWNVLHGRSRRSSASSFF